MGEENKNIDQSLDALLDDDLLNDGVGVESLDKLKKKKTPISKKNKILMGVTVFFAFLLALVFGIYYFLYLTTVSPDKLGNYQKGYVAFVKNNFFGLLGFGKLDKNVSLSSINNQNKVVDVDYKIKKYINSPSNLFYDKIDFKRNFIKKFQKNVNKSYSEINKYNNLILKYKFFPKEISDVVKDIKILPILVVLNSIKLYTTDYAFYKAELFDSKVLSYVLSRSNFIGKYPKISQNDLKSAIKEDLLYFKDIGASIYLKDIYFNYMYTDDGISNTYFVNQFNQVFSSYLEKRYDWFKKYYPNVPKSEFISNYLYIFSSVYSRTLSLSDSSEELPVDVQLISYDPKTQKMAFNITLMLSPDVYSKLSIVDLMSNIVTFLRESRLIIGKDIKYDGLKVVNITKKVGGYRVIYQKVSQKFSTSVQSKVNIEVTDSTF